MRKTIPVHEHDCDDCVYLKTVTKSKIKYDLYFCSIRDGRSTVIARYGSDGDYLSGLSFAYNGLLKKAAMLSMERGLLDEYEYAKQIAWTFNPRVKKKLKGVG
jgi:hypothetical protein